MGKTSRQRRTRRSPPAFTQEEKRGRAIRRLQDLLAGPSIGSVLRDQLSENIDQLKQQPHLSAAELPDRSADRISKTTIVGAWLADCALSHDPAFQPGGKFAGFTAWYDRLNSCDQNEFWELCGCFITEESVVSYLRGRPSVPSVSPELAKFEGKIRERIRAGQDRTTVVRYEVRRLYSKGYPGRGWPRSEKALRDKLNRKLVDFAE